MPIACGPVATYFAAQWHHDRDSDPVVLYEQLDDTRRAARKVHEYRDGDCSEVTESESLDSLSWAEVPSTDEIDADPEFTVLPLTAREFQQETPAS